MSTMSHRHHGRGVESLPLVAPSDTYRFTAPRRGRAILASSLLATMVLTGYSGYRAVTDAGTSGITATGIGVVTVVVLWAMLQARLPQVVTLQHSVIEIRNNGKVERFDLADPSVEILARDGEIAFRCYDGRAAVVRARDVDWRLFTDVVMHYQDHADRRAAERRNRYSR
jgi:hypothetical protein